MPLNDSGDAADRVEASALDDPADRFVEGFCPRCNHSVDAVCPDCRGHVEPGGHSCDASEHSDLERGEFYRRLVNLLQSARNTKFTAGCYLIATGDAFADGVSMTEFAAEWGVVKATVSKECVRICGYLHIKPSRYMRREETKESYRNSNRRPSKTL